MYTQHLSLQFLLGANFFGLTGYHGHSDIIILFVQNQIVSRVHCRLAGRELQIINEVVLLSIGKER
jgi:hypothetical protein